MSRAARLLDLIQVLRRHRRPVAAQRLADELGVSVRTVYRDIAELVRQGAPVSGSAGLGYAMGPGFTLPPLNFGEVEAEAITLGLRFVAMRGDAELAKAARDGLAKINAVMPEKLRDRFPHIGLLAGPGRTEAPADLAPLRAAIRDERIVDIRYSDAAKAPTRRRVWPLALAFFDSVEVLVAWCELRGDFRHFRADRISGARILDERLPERRAALLRRWRAREGVSDEL